MAEFGIVPKIYYFDTVAAFHEVFALGPRDVIVTRRAIFERFLRPLGVSSHVLYRADYGSGEPSDEMIDRMAADMKKLDYDRIIALGGGSVLDMCKLLALALPQRSADILSGEAKPRKAKQLIAVPTTPGTGSEVTCVSAVENTSTGVKKGFSSPEMYPDAAVLIPEVNDDLPYETFRMSSIDMFITACESYLSPKANEYTDLFAKEAIRIYLPIYRQLAEEGPDTRFTNMKQFVLASNFAGIAFGVTGVGAVHALAYSIGGAFHVAHGESTYAFFLAVLRKYEEKNPAGKIRALKQVLAEGLGCAEAAVWQTLAALLQGIMPYKKLREHGMREEQIEAFTASTIANQQRLLVNNYAALDAADMHAIYKELL
jgi:4-hydroxybutyrate dehydrogenase